MAPETRTNIVSLKLSKDELNMLKGLCGATGLSQSDVLRQALRAFWADKQIQAPKPKR